MHIMAPRGHDMHTLTCILGRKPRGTGAAILVLMIMLGIMGILANNVNNN